ncbi:hypothetical protein N7462_009160 [Penicillium macrosclerotiorum]|uniref:uncharacterized protein n=1 Tax=Penicillium macrosclerotiorum TaxID=303699 RepID=UPI0025481C73|nr:uncharacterized protein N7462_009160 [Penicillium macrosclerotiorum]KAJ5676263.1 hypothetical protein N7462_009160 [Penicillium macrosclerotiorum]
MTAINSFEVDATFSETSSLYQIITNSTANCSLELYSWAIPSNLNTSNPEYQIGLFDGAAFRGTYGIEDYGWISWSPFFYVRDKTSAISASKTASVTSLLTGTGETSPTTHSTSTSTSSSSSSSSSSSDGAAVATTASSSDQTPSSNSAAVDAGIGVGVGAAALIVLGLVWFFWRRRNSKRTGTDNQQSQTSELPGRPVFELPTAIPVTEKKGELEGYNS